jgi:hypothetical protein
LSGRWAFLGFLAAIPFFLLFKIAGHGKAGQARNASQAFFIPPLRLSGFSRCIGGHRASFRMAPEPGFARRRYILLKENIHKTPIGACKRHDNIGFSFAQPFLHGSIRRKQAAAPVRRHNPNADHAMRAPCGARPIEASNPTALRRQAIKYANGLDALTKATIRKNDP